MEQYRPMRAECQAEFKKLHDRIDRKADEVKKVKENIHDNEIEITKVSEDVQHITKSINGLTKALWGIAGSTMVTLFGFLLWYIQNL